SRHMREHVVGFLIVGSGFMRYAVLALRGSPYEILTLVLSAVTFIILIGWMMGVGYWQVRQRIALLNQRALRARKEGGGARVSRAWLGGERTGMIRGTRPMLELRARRG